MEFIKKRILRVTTTGTTTGCTGTCRVIIPDPKAKYYIKFCLVQDAEDIGFLDAYEVSGSFNYIKLSGATIGATEVNIKKFESVLSGGTTLAASGLPTGKSTGVIIGIPVVPTSVVITGESTSRLIELKKALITNNFYKQYLSGGTYTKNGVDYTSPYTSSGISAMYYIDGIRYLDIFVGFSSGTTFRFMGQGYNSPNFINKPVCKNQNKENIISNPKIYDDVFINRQETSAFDKNYRLEYITSLVDLETYAGGKFFKIEKNT